MIRSWESVNNIHGMRRGDGSVSGPIAYCPFKAAESKAGIGKRKREKNGPFMGPERRVWTIGMGCSKTLCGWG
jgi:hypothetical protein